MQIKNNQFVFSPSDLMVYFKSPFESAMKRYWLEHPELAQEIEKDLLLEILAKKGYSNESDYLKILKSQYSNLVEIDRKQGFDKSHAETLNAIKQGADVIFQATLKKDNMFGYSDFLIKTQRPSKLGDYSYEVYDSKLAVSAKPEYFIELCCYSEMIEAIQGTLPEHIHLILGSDHKPVKYRLNDFYYYYNYIKKQFLDFHHHFNKDQHPNPPEPWEELNEFADYIENYLIKTDDLSLISGITWPQIKKFHSLGIKTTSQLAEAKLEQKPKGMQEHTFERLKKQAYMQKQTQIKGTPQFEVRDHNVKTAEGELLRFGLRKLPPHHPADVFFDMEGYPLEDNNGLEYLYGNTHLNNGKIEFKDFWALNKSQEQEAFESFIDWIYSRWQQNPGMHIFHYASYEVTAVTKLMCAYSTKIEEVDELLRAGVFVDLYQIVREGLIIGKNSYSIKKLEDYYNFKRSSDVKKADDSVIQFAQWIELQDGSDWKTSNILKQIRDYNEEDCVSTYKLTLWLYDLQKEYNIEYLQNPNTNTDGKKNRIDPVLIEASNLEKSIPIEQPAIKYALNYHHREEKPQWWSHFDRLSKMPEELYDDMECLALCKLKNKNNDTVTYSFDNNQDTKLEDGSDIIIHGFNNKVSSKILNFDYETQEVTLKWSNTVTPPEEITLIPNTMPVNASNIKKAIIEVAKEFNNKGSVSNKALNDLLTRSNPKIDGIKDGEPIINENNDIVEESIKACKNLKNSVLAIQGSPGTGKTYTASRMVANLLIENKRVAITSNSHKAINNLTKEVHKYLVEQNIRNNYSICKVAGNDADFAKSIDARYVDKNGDYWKYGNRDNLVAGTAWLLSNKEAINKFDYLFIDEAGQFSMANTIAIARCANNIILLGDQMQLQQPIQGQHPEEIKKSVLEYYLSPYETVPNFKGIFLGVSRRMHPDICNFISKMFYECRLTSHECTFNNIISDKYRGIIFIPVEHEGNTQGSNEEVDAILNMLTKTKDCININDCLFVAPYNLQVAKLKRALGENARVGSVDLFQGQEAPVVFLSLCSSEGSSSPRGLTFLLDKHRINVAISRAKSLAVVVGNPRLVQTKVSNVNNMKALNLLCSIME